MEFTYDFKALSQILDKSKNETKIEIKRLLEEKILVKHGNIYTIANTSKGTEFLRNKLIDTESRIMNMGGTIPPSKSDMGPGFT